MAKMEIKGLDELVAKMEKLGQHPEGYVKRAVYVGAGVIADGIKTALGGIPTDEEYGTEKNPREGITQEEKASLISGFGISRMEEANGQVTVSLGFTGRNVNGNKNSTVMRKVESGTSYMKKHPTIRPAANRTRAKATAEMQRQFERDMQETINS